MSAVCRAAFLFLIPFSVLGQAWAAESESPKSDAFGPVQPVRIVYFVTSDRKPIQGYDERLDRVMTEVQRFYREGMQAAGFKPSTFGLDRDESGRLRIDMVQGKLPMRGYGRDDAGRVRDEVREALAKIGVDINRQTVVIFQTLLEWDGGKAVEIGPYVGGGDYRAGTAWVYDDALLDAKSLSSKEPGGYYGQPCSIGEFNSHYIGGVAHELGHAFGLPHDCQRKADQPRGSSLMGGGNHTYGQELRGEGPGTFLSAASAMLLACSQPFAGRQNAGIRRPACRLSEFEAQAAGNSIVLTGKVVAEPRAFGIIAYDDWKKIPADYDAVGWTCRVADDGRFRLDIGELRPGESQLRLRVCRTDGTSQEYAFDYTVDDSGKADVAPFQYRIPLDEAVKAYAAGDRQRAASLAGQLQTKFANTPEVRRKAIHLRSLVDPPTLKSLADLANSKEPVSLSSVKYRDASVGWGRPLADQVLVEPPGQCFLQVGGQFYEYGLYAHAPASYEFELAANWKRFQTACGLQDGHDGSVVFVVQGDGRELFRSDTIRDHKLRTVDVDIAGVKGLKLLVENGGDGASGDWGVWIEPRLTKDGGGQ